MPRQPRGPAPKGSQQKLEGAPPSPGSSSHRSGANALAYSSAVRCAPPDVSGARQNPSGAAPEPPQLLGSRPSAYGEKQSVPPSGTGTPPTVHALSDVRPTKGTGG